MDGKYKFHFLGLFFPYWCPIRILRTDTRSTFPYFYLNCVSRKFILKIRSIVKLGFGEIEVSEKMTNTKKSMSVFIVSSKYFFKFSSHY